MIELFAASAPLFIGTVFVLSLLIGSFLNVVIHRLPIMMEREWQAQAHRDCCAAAPGLHVRTPRARSPAKSTT